MNEWKNNHLSLSRTKIRFLVLQQAAKLLYQLGPILGLFQNQNEMLFS
jgi:hypothetical protein